MTELKACPFCYGEAKRDIVGQVECVECGVMKFDDEAWNIRHYPKEVQAVLDAAKVEIKMHEVGVTADGRPFNHVCTCELCSAVKRLEERDE